jgi:P-type E1-E2 ATPase
VQKLSERERKELEATFLALSEEGLRVVAVAEKRTKVDYLRPHEVKDLEFVGFVAMKDALRPEVEAAMRKTAAAGMRVVMITGDHQVTAEAVVQAGLAHHDRGRP